MMWLTTFLLATSVFLLVKFFRERLRALSAWKRRGVPGPEPHFLWGNTSEFRIAGVNPTLDHWRKIYGKTYGYCEGPKAVLVTSDPEVIKEVLVKQFDKFQDRKPLPFTDFHGKYVNIARAKGARWKRQRNILSPIFTARRMKQMSPLVNEAMDAMMGLLKTRHEKGEPFDIYGDFQKLTFDVIASCAFGLEHNALTDPGYLDKHRKILRAIENGGILIHVISALSLLFPKFMDTLRPLSSLLDPTMPSWFIKSCGQIINERKNSKIKRDDFVDLMLDAHMDDEECSQTEVFPLGMDQNEAMDDVISGGPQQNGLIEKNHKKTNRGYLSHEDMVSQSMVFFMAGFDTSSAALAFIAYELARHPGIQRKVQEEIQQQFPEQDPRPDYLMTRCLPYLEMVVNEGLRLYPVGQFVTTRECGEDCTIRGIRIRKDDLIQIHMNGIHYDPEHWGPEDPGEFVPERFLPECVRKRHPMAYLPFGQGPRHCIGMRFGLMEIKIALVRILKRFTFRICDQTSIPLLVEKNAFVSPREGVWITLESNTSDEHL